MRSPQGDDIYWSVSFADVAMRLGSGTWGLTAEQATAQLAAMGPNSVYAAVRLGAFRLFLLQVESPLVLILTFAASIWLVFGQRVDAGIIVAILAGSSILVFFLEFRASSAVVLNKRVAFTARILRDGFEKVPALKEFVHGDAFLISAGNLIPADSMVLEAQDLLVTKASMTGDSFQDEK